MWYGQKETDKVISNYFPSGHIGKCIEVGVSDGIKGSNSKYFEDLGWETLCIDPIPEHVVQAKKIRKNVIEVACVGPDTLKESNGEKLFYVFEIGDKNIKSSLSGLNTDNRLLVSHGHLINSCYNIKVKVDTLNNIIKDTIWSNDLDFISIDTEGTELDVLKGIELLINPPKLLVVENNFEDANIEEYLKSYGYKKTERYFVNDFYVQDK